MLARKCSKCFKLGFNSVWTKNFQKYRLGLEETEEPEIKVPTPTGSQDKQGIPEKRQFCFGDYARALTVWVTTSCWRFLRRRDFTCLPRNLYAGEEATESDMEQQTGSKLGKEFVKAVYCHPAYLTSM